MAGGEESVHNSLFLRWERICRHGVFTPLVVASTRAIITNMNLLVIIIVLVLLFGGGGYYYGGVGFGGGGIVSLLVLLLVLRLLGVI
jgi:hypothetical protein